MSPFILKILQVLVLGVVGIITINSIPQKKANSSNQTPVRCCNSENLLHRQLKDAAQKALDAIGSKRKLTASNNRANRGQHVFNNGLLGFHRSVLQDLLRDVGGYDEQLENLMEVLVIPLSQTQQDAISTIMVARFSSKDEYVDYNADVFGEYVRQLRQALVKYLKADTSVHEGGRRGIHEIRQQVRNITSAMVNHEVYVDPMARDRWLQENRDQEQMYNQVRRALRNMFQDILQDFKKVSDKIRVFRRRNNWNWNRNRDDIK